MADDERGACPRCGGTMASDADSMLSNEGCTSVSCLVRPKEDEQRGAGLRAWRDHLRDEHDENADVSPGTHNARMEAISAALVRDAASGEREAAMVAAAIESAALRIEEVFERPDDDLAAAAVRSITPLAASAALARMIEAAVAHEREAIRRDLDEHGWIQAAEHVRARGGA